MGSRASLLSVFFYFGTVGCSSWAYRTFACDQQFPHEVVAGIVTIVGDCSISKNFHIETGDFYRNRKDSIDVEVKTYRLDQKDSTGLLIDFAKSYNCSGNSFKAFADMLKINSDYIFGEDFSHGARRARLRIIDKIEEDPVLRQYCMR